MRAPLAVQCGRVLIVLVTDGRANVGLARSNGDPAACAPDAPRPSPEELRGEVVDMARRAAAEGESVGLGSVVGGRW